MRERSVLITYAASDSDAALALSSAEDVQRALGEQGYAARTVALEDVTVGMLQGCDLVFTADSNPPPSWLRSVGAGLVDAFKSHLQAQGIRFTGSSPEAIALAKNKLLAKQAFATAGLAVPAALPTDSLNGRFPFIVKPITGAASKGVQFISDANAFASVIAETDARSIFVEEYIAGREMTVGVIESPEGAKALHPIEIELAESIFTAHRKLTRPFPPCRPVPKSDPACRAATAAAEAAFVACGCGGYARVDIRYNSHRGAVVLEINTAPRLSRNEYFAMSARSAALEFNDVVNSILRAAHFSG